MSSLFLALLPYLHLAVALSDPLPRKLLHGSEIEGGSGDTGSNKNKGGSGGGGGPSGNSGGPGGSDDSLSPTLAPGTTSSPVGSFIEYTSTRVCANAESSGCRDAEMQCGRQIACLATFGQR